MEESRKTSQALLSDDLSKLCDETAAIAKAARRVERLLDALLDEREHFVARQMVLQEARELIAIVRRCTWNGEG